jgi:hypothetical protein
MSILSGGVLCLNGRYMNIQESVPTKLNPVSACSYTDKQLTHNS